jgi:hypothetical protein
MLEPFLHLSEKASSYVGRRCRYGCACASVESAALIRMLTRMSERLYFLLALSREHPTIYEDYW